MNGCQSTSPTVSGVVIGVSELDRGDRPPEVVRGLVIQQLIKASAPAVFVMANRRACWTWLSPSSAAIVRIREISAPRTTPEGLRSTSEMTDERRCANYLLHR